MIGERASGTARFGTLLAFGASAHRAKEFFQEFEQSAGIKLHLETLYCANNGYPVESCSKALAQVLKMARVIDPFTAEELPPPKRVN